MICGLALLLSSLTLVDAAVYSQTQVWKNVVIGAGGFVPGIVFSPVKQGLAYVRTDIGGAYRSNGDTWVPLNDYVNDTTWNHAGVESIAPDPINPDTVYGAVGMYTIYWDSRNGSIIKSTDLGRTWTTYPLPFKCGGNMPGRGMGERLAIDPHNNKILYLGARSGNGLWKSTNWGVTWSKVTSFPDAGTYIPHPSDSSGYNADKVGVVWVTFDSNSKNSAGTPRIFVGVATLGAPNIYRTDDGGVTWQALPTFASNTLLPHKGVLSPNETSLYVSFNNGAGPYDGTAGRVGKYNITSGTWTDITPVLAVSENYYGFGGLAVDLQKPGTVMVATLNQWWPDANIFRTTDGGATWTTLWSWNGYPNLNRYFGVDNSEAPYLGGPLGSSDFSHPLVGWMIEALVIDPFDSNHWLYGTGATISGGHDLLNWDTARNVSIRSIVKGLEETAVLGLISRPSGSHLLSVVGDIGGFNHIDFNKPSVGFTNPTYGTTTGIDYAGKKPAAIVRVGNVEGSNDPQIALSADGGATWAPYPSLSGPASAPGYLGGSVALSANGDAILWSSNGQGVLLARNNGSFAPVSGIPAYAKIASDKVNGTVLYAASGSSFYVSTNSGSSFTTSTLDNMTTPQWIAASPYKAGELWISSNTGITHSIDYGKTWTALPSISSAWQIAVGAPMQPNGPTVVYAAGTLEGINALYRTDDGGANWIKLSDETHGFGAVSTIVLAADPRIYKR
ncbi:putative endoglucanase C [Serendipita vermifera]|nr:putative endoglucanase C [Serendipita vermifera]